MIEMMQLKTQELTFERAAYIAKSRQDLVVVLRPSEGKLVAVYGVTASGAVEEVQPDTLRVSIFERIGFQLVSSLDWKHKHQRERIQAALGAVGTLIDAVDELVKTGIYIRTKDGLVRAS